MSGVPHTLGGMDGRWAATFEDTFEGDRLDPEHWLPCYLPHWSSRAQSAARHEVSDGTLQLRIDDDQPPWCPEFDGDQRASSIQTGVFAGPVGSAIGQHRFNPAARVREAQEPQRLFTPHRGRIELRARVTPDPRRMCALWLIGFEDAPERSAELCLMEIFGRDVHPGHTAVGVGIHPFGDPTITDDFERVRVPIDASRWQTYALDWHVDHVVFRVNGAAVKRVAQSPDYPMQLMLSLYERADWADGAAPVAAERRADPSWDRFVVDAVRGWRWVEGRG